MVREGLLYKIVYKTTVFDARHSLVLVVLEQEKMHYFRLCQNIKSREADIIAIETDYKRGNIWTFENIVVPELQNQSYNFNISSKTFQIEGNDVPQF